MATISLETDAPASLVTGASRLLVIGGILLILAGMTFGDIFAVFILHPNAGRIGENLLAATEAVAAGDPETVGEHFSRVGGLLENRGTKVDTHSHMVNLGYIALLLALVQPFVALSERRKRQWAVLYLTGSTILPVAVFVIYYVGLAYSPFEDIGWASIFADLAGLLAIVACAGMLAGIWSYFRGARTTTVEEVLFRNWSWAGRTLLAGGLALILAGFLYGAYYAGVDLYNHEKRDAVLLRAMIDNAASGDLVAAREAINGYGGLGAEKAVKVAAHAHIIEFGLLAMLLSFLQQYVFLAEPWKRRWVWILLTGSVVLPVFVLAELWWGLVAGGIADIGGLMVIVALAGMLAGVIRHTGKLDAQRG